MIMKPDKHKTASARKVRFAAFMGFGVGVLGGAGYLLLGGEYIFNIPRWASIAFYPGFFAGLWAINHLHVGVLMAQIIGVIAVGLTYALMAAIARWIWLAVSQRRNKTGEK